MFYLSPTYWFGGSNSNPQPQDQQQQTRTELQERTMGAAERGLKAVRLLGLNAATMLTVNLDLLCENSWLGKQYSDIWNGRTFEWVQVPVEGENQERTLVPLIPAEENGDLVPQNGERRLTGKDIADSLVGKNFSVELAEGIEGQLTILDHTTTLFNVSQEQLKQLQAGEGQLPMLEQQPSSGILAPVMNALFGVQEGSVPMQREKIHFRVRVGDIDTFFRITLQAPKAQFTPNFVRSFVANMMGQLPAPLPLVGKGQPQALAGLQQPLMIEGQSERVELPLVISEGADIQQPVKVSMNQIGFLKTLTLPNVEIRAQQGQPLTFDPFSSGFHQEGLPNFGIGLGAGIYRGVLNLRQPVQNRVIKWEDVDTVVQEEDILQVDRQGEVPPRGDEAGQNEDQGNFNILKIIFDIWGKRAQSGEFFRNRNVNQQNDPQNQSWYARLWAAVSRAIAYVKQQTTGVYNNWWTTAQPQDTVRLNFSGVNAQVDILGMQLNQRNTVIEEI